MANVRSNEIDNLLPVAILSGMQIGCKFARVLLLLLLLVGRPILIEKYGQTIHGLEYYGPRHNVVVLLGYTRGTGHV